jgi:hypothetical protein
MVPTLTLCAEARALRGFIPFKPLNQARLPIERGLRVLRPGFPLPHNAQD